MSFHGLYGLSGHFVLCVLARSALVFVLHSKWKKQRKEKSHAHCHVTHRIRIFEKIFEHSKFQNRLHLLYQRGCKYFQVQGDLP